MANDKAKELADGANKAYAELRVNRNLTTASSAQAAGIVAKKAAYEAERINAAAKVKDKTTADETQESAPNVGKMIESLEDRIFKEQAQAAAAAKAAGSKAAVPVVAPSQNVPAKAAPTIPKAPSANWTDHQSKRREVTRSPRAEGRTNTSEQNATARRRVSWSPTTVRKRTFDSGGQGPPQKLSLIHI